MINYEQKLQSPILIKYVKITYTRLLLFFETNKQTVRTLGRV
jgi:hypothetical protein